MIIDRQETKGINGKAVVNQFVYLRPLITNLGRCTLEVKGGQRLQKKSWQSLP